MIPKQLRKRLETFVCEHEKCEEPACILAAARAWVKQMRDRKFPDRELLLLALAFQAYAVREQINEQKLRGYESAIAGFVAKKTLPAART